AGGLDARYRQAQQPRGLDGEGEGRPGGHADYAEGGRAAGAAGLLAQNPGREMDARRQDQRHLRRYAADQHDNYRASNPELQQQGIELESCVLKMRAPLESSGGAFFFQYLFPGY